MLNYFFNIHGRTLNFIYREIKIYLFYSFIIIIIFILNYQPLF